MYIYFDLKYRDIHREFNFRGIRFSHIRMITAINYWLGQNGGKQKSSAAAAAKNTHKTGSLG